MDIYYIERLHEAIETGSRPPTPPVINPTSSTNTIIEGKEK
jgi:hypothetical protein